MKEQTIAITMGDPAGVGPEIIAAAIGSGRLTAGGAAGTSTEDCPATTLVLGHSAIMQRAFDRLGIPCQVRSVSSIEDYWGYPEDERRRGAFCLDCVGEEAVAVPPGKVDPRGGEAAYRAVAAAAQLALEGKIAAMVTAPLHKEALHLAGHHWPGHTEMLGDLCGVETVAMMLYLPPYDDRDPIVAGLPPRLRLGPLGLGVGHVTLHTSMRSALDELQGPRIVDTCQLVHQVMSGFARAYRLDRDVRLGVAALNPHAGESGLFGREELDVIAPALQLARQMGISLSDALPCDTLMVRAAAGEFDGVVAMYHDQGHIALKLLGMQRAVNIALGLPIVRTSVAHGTAFDRAWQGRADHQSLLHAVRVAWQLAPMGRTLFLQKL